MLHSWKKQHQDFPQATPDRQLPWGRREPEKRTGMFDHVAIRKLLQKHLCTVNSAGQ